MEQLEQWFEEASVIKVFTGESYEFVIRKGFKITHYFEDDSYTIQDTRFNDFYTKVSEADMEQFVLHGFIKGTDILMNNRNINRVKKYIKKIEDTYVKRKSSVKLGKRTKGFTPKHIKTVAQNKAFYTKAVNNCNINIHKYHDMMQFYQAKIDQFNGQQNN